MSDDIVVVIAIDGSEQAKKALLWYIDNLRKPSHKLLLVHIAESPFVSSQQAVYMNAEVWEEILKRDKERVKALEEEYADMLRSHGCAGKIKAIYGNPGEMLSQLAKEENAGMIVMGTRGQGAVRRTIMGSVSDYVLHHSHCPVVICRH